MTATPNTRTDLNLIREAARTIRTRAEAATHGPWFTTSESARYGGLVATPTNAYPEHNGYAGHLIGESMSAANRDHVAGWHPAVAVAVADWLDSIADRADADGITGSLDEPHALAVARAYLAPTGIADGGEPRG